MKINFQTGMTDKNSSLDKTNNHNNNATAKVKKAKSKIKDTFENSELIPGVQIKIGPQSSGESQNIFKLTPKGVAKSLAIGAFAGGAAAFMGIPLLGAVAFGGLATFKGLSAFCPGEKKETATPTKEKPSKPADKALVKEQLLKMKDKDSMVRIKAVRQLYLTGDKSLIPHIAKALNDEAAEVRSVAAYVLSKTESKKAVPYLLKALETEKKPFLRGEIILDLRNLNDKRAVPSLLKALKEDDEDISFYASLALKKSGDKRALIPLAKYKLKNKAAKLGNKIKKS